ncbi:uncharacterized protein LOC119743628 [Patiria miniata]|uniref:Uncharacterized protein n=1 Tax=Patiria miniata TaxID=46514 RepID=A0A914BJ85_PATMI|nr:uncharacterized protein LOC119743628 [Patiria miniata]
MASTRSKPMEHQIDRQKSGTAITGELLKDANDCLIDKALSTLVAMAQNKPKLSSTLQNALVPCTVVAPYMNPLDALAAANETSTQPTVSVDVPHAKRRVYTVLETVQKASKAWLGLKRSEGRKYDLAPRQSDIEKEIVIGAIEWLQSLPEGTEDSLVAELVQRCEKEADCSRLVLKKFQKAGYLRLDEHGRLTYHLPQTKPGPSSQPRGAQARVLCRLRDCPPTIRPVTEAKFLEFVQPVCKAWFTVPPARFLGMNMKRIRHRNVKESKKSESGKNDSKSEPQKSKQSETESASQMETEFAIGVYTGENNVREHISITPGGVTGIEVSVTGQATLAKRLKKPSAKRLDNANRMRAVGQTKGLSDCLTQRMTVAVRGHNAVLVPANEEEKKNIISKVTSWLSSMHNCSSTCTGQSAQQQTVPKLQQELANMCVGKVRRLAPSTITNLLQTAGYISIGGDHKVAYNLPTNRGDNTSKTATPTWQQKTVELAVKNCNFSSRLRQAFPRRKTKGAKEVPVKKTKNVQTQQSYTAAMLQDDEDIGDDYLCGDYGLDDYGDAYDDGIGNFDDVLDCYDPYDDYGCEDY